MLDLKKIPIISLNTAGFEKQPGFSLSLPFIHKALIAVSYGDLLMKLLYRTRPYEVNYGESDKIYKNGTN